jgi:hypothetical protein
LNKLIETIEEELMNIQRKQSVSRIEDGDNHYQVSLRYKFIQVVGTDSHFDPSTPSTVTSGFTHSGQNLGPGVEYEITISGNVTYKIGTSNPIALHQKRG